MEIVKKNVISIVLGIVAILAVVAIFYPIGGLFDHLKTQVSQDEQLYGKAKAIYTAPHDLPLSDNLNSTERKTLGVFPEPKITQDAKTARAELISESTGVYDAANLANQTECMVHPDEKTLSGRMLLVDGSLPLPAAGSSADAEFKKALDPEIDHLHKIMDAVTPPTKDDIDAETQRLKKEYDAKKFLNGQGTAINATQIDAAFAAASANVPERLRNERALNHHMYMDATAIVLPTEIVSSPQPPSPQLMYFAQAAIWMEEDLCRAIAEVNTGSNDVLHAPVKRLISISIPAGASMFLRAPAENATPGAAVDAAAGGQSNGAPRAYYSITPTGRTCNGMYDVVTALVTLHVDAGHIPALMTALNHNRFMTVRNLNVSQVDSNDLLNQGYAYGSGAVVELKLDCEQLQMREWTTKLMPPAIVALLGADGKTDYFNQTPLPPVTGAAGASVQGMMSPSVNPGITGGAGSTVGHNMH